MYLLINLRFWDSIRRIAVQTNSTEEYVDICDRVPTPAARKWMYGMYSNLCMYVCILDSRCRYLEMLRSIMLSN